MNSVMKSSPRSLKLAGLIQDTLPLIFFQFANVEQFGFLSVVHVVVSPDLRVAEVVIQSVNAPKGFLKKLQKIAPKLAYELSQKISLRGPIELRFVEGNML